MERFLWLVVLFLVMFVFREFWGQREKEHRVNTVSPALPSDQTHGVKRSVGPTLHNVGTQPSTSHAEHYPRKEIALKC